MVTIAFYVYLYFYCIFRFCLFGDNKYNTNNIGLSARIPQTLSHGLRQHDEMLVMWWCGPSICSTSLITLG